MGEGRGIERAFLDLARYLCVDEVMSVVERGVIVATTGRAKCGGCMHGAVVCLRLAPFHLEYPGMLLMLQDLEADRESREIERDFDG